MRTHISVVVRRSKVLAFLFQDCVICGVIFGMPDDLDNARRHNGQMFYCPNGHAQEYTETETALLSRELREARDDLATTRAQLAQERSASARLRERVKHGVCAVCHRSFANVARHYTTKHSAV